jgi:hypothetical protein
VETDSHIVASHSVVPILTAPVKSWLPKVTPLNVAQMDPVDAEFEVPTILTSASLKERDSLTDAARAPKLMESRREICIVWTEKQLIDVSDSHLDASDVVTPKTPRTE